MLAGNKLSKYLIYAIGEIVLVVIGILIALASIIPINKMLWPKVSIWSWICLKNLFIGTAYRCKGSLITVKAN